MSTKYIFYKPTKTPTVSELTKGIQANKRLSTDLNNSRKNYKQPKVTLTKTGLAEEFDKPFIEVRKSLIRKLNEYELANAGNYDDPEVNATIEDYKRQIKDFAKFTTGEAGVYETLVKASKNPLDENKNPTYDVSSLKRMPKFLQENDIKSVMSNMDEGDDISYLFGESNPLKEGDNYVYDEEGFLLDENYNPIKGFNRDGSEMTTDEFVFENRRKFVYTVNPEDFSFGTRGVEYKGVFHEDVPQFNFDENEVMKSPKNVDFVANLIKGIKVDSSFKKPVQEGGGFITEGEKQAKNQIESKLQKVLNASTGQSFYKDDSARGSLQIVANAYARDEQGIDEPTDAYIDELVDSYENSQDFREYAVDYIYEAFAEGKARSGNSVMNFNILGGGKVKNYAIGLEANKSVVDLENVSLVNGNGVSRPITTQMFSKVTTITPKKKTNVSYETDILFLEGIAGLEKLVGKAFTFQSQEVRIHAIDKSTNQIATKEQIIDKDPNVEFIPFAFATAKPNDKEELNEFTNKVNSLPPEQQNSFLRLQSLLTQEDSAPLEVLVPINKMYDATEIDQFKFLQDEADRLNKEYKGSETEAERDQRLMNMYPSIKIED